LASGTTTSGAFTDLLQVEMDAAGTLNLSNLVLNNTLADGVGGVDVTGAGADTIIGTSGNDTITAADVTGAATFTGGAGADTYALDDSIAGNAGTATVVIGSGDTGTTTGNIDIITDFETGIDSLKLGTAGSATNFATGTNNTDLADSITAANTAFDGTVQFFHSFDLDGVGDGGNSFLIADFNLDGTADAAIQLTGIDAAIVIADIIA
jgi:hypothetical protein